VDITVPVEDLAHRLTMAGLPVDAIERVGGTWDRALVCVGLVTEVNPHPNADRLRLATVDLGGGERHTVVCGAPNVAAGQKVAFARAGARLIDGHTGKEAVLKPAVIRGVESAGMVLSEKELGLSDSHEGILELPADAPVGQPLADYLGDIVFDVSVTPNRPDLLSVLGVAREVAALTGAALREPDPAFAADGAPIEGRVQVQIKDPDLCPRYVATLVEGVKIGPSPAWMQERLNAAGQRPINNVVDVTNYVMLELGQPLHAFDYDRLTDGTIIVRRALDGERMTTLDGTEHVLSRERLVIADPAHAVAVAGVMGGEDSEVTDKTRNILLEAANFNAANIRRTAAALKSPTEASRRFEKGISAELAMVASRRATKLLVEVCGGRAAAGVIDIYPKKERPLRIEVTRRRIHQVLGIDPKKEQVRAALSALGFGVRWLPPETFVVRVPYWRTDVRIHDDVVEEVARVIGYDEIPVEPLAGRIPAAIMQPLRELREEVRWLLAKAGMQEVITYPLTSVEVLETASGGPAARPPVRIANPMSQDQAYLRTTLRGSLLQTLASNQRFREEEIALYETARVYLPADGRAPVEQEHAVGVVGGRRRNRWGLASDEPVDLFDARAYLDAAFVGLGVEPEYRHAEEPGMLPGRCAIVGVEGKRVGVLGQVHPDVASALGVEGDVYLFELVLDDLLPLLPGRRKAEPVPRFPSVVEDLALIVDRDVPAGRVRSLIESTPLVRQARIFDVYEGRPVPEGKKSLAYSVSYQAPDRTLTEEDVARARRRLLERLRRELGAELRS